MDALKLYDDVASECAKRTTKAYSTSFSLGIRFLAPSLREAIYNIYGFVRYADEIVDTFTANSKKRCSAVSKTTLTGRWTTA